MSFEVEIPKHYLKRIMGTGSILAVILSLLMIGHAVSPLGASGQPFLLSPRLMALTSYYREVQQWLNVMQEIQDELDALLSDGPADLLTQDSLADHLYGQLLNLQSEMDETSIPPTLETLQSSFIECVLETLEAAEFIAVWIAEPTEDNYMIAEEAQNQATEALFQLRQNPWSQVQP